MISFLAGLILAWVVARIPTGQPEAPWPTCDCAAIDGGCAIIDPPPEGYKCDCTGFFMTCYGHVKKCEPDEICPANCTSYECCMRGDEDSKACSPKADNYDWNKH